MSNTVLCFQSVSINKGCTKSVVSMSFSNTLHPAALIALAVWSLVNL